MRFRHHIACFCSISTTKNNSKHSHHSTVLSLSNMTVFRSWMNQSFKWFGSIAMTHLLTVICWHILAILISHLKYLLIFSLIINFLSFQMSIQHFMSCISKHYSCICNCRLNAFLSCTKQCVNTSKCHFRWSFCISSALKRWVCWYWFAW